MERTMKVTASADSEVGLGPSEPDILVSAAKMGAIGALVAVLFFKTVELLFDGLLGGSFQLSPAEKGTMVVVILATAVLIASVPSLAKENARLRKQNDEKLELARKDLEDLKQRRFQEQ
jgi:hypothetical protein